MREWNGLLQIRDERSVPLIYGRPLAGLKEAKSAGHLVVARWNRLAPVRKSDAGGRS